MATRNIQWYGWRKDSPDIRDFKYAASRSVLEALPPSVDLTTSCPPVLDQGSLGSCTANAIGSAFRFEQRRQDMADDFAPSRLFIYYNEREMEGTVASDAGAEIRDGMKSVANQGVCPEEEWPYVPVTFTVKPSEACYAHAANHQVVQYMRVGQTLEQLKGCLAEGFPFVFGFTVYESFESQEVSRTGVMPMPRWSERIMGGHAVMAVGYDDATRRFKVRNSWGEDWGDKGNFTMPYEYMCNASLAADFWTIRLVEDEVNPGPTPGPAPTPTPQPHGWCSSVPGFREALTAFVDGALDEKVCAQTVDQMARAGLKGLQTHIRAMERLEAARKGKGC